MGKIMKKTITLEINVDVPVKVSEAQVEHALNGALDEPPCDWEDWGVGAFQVKNVSEPFEGDDDLDDDSDEE